MLSNLKSGKRLFPLFDFTTGFGAFPARLRTNDQMTVGCLLRSLRLPKKTNLRFFDRRILPPIMFLFDTYCRSSKTGSKETTCPSSTTSRMKNAVVGFWFIIAALLILPFGIANIFVTIRRLHDMGYSGYWYFALLAAGMFASALDKVVPVASLIVTVIVYVCLSQKSQPGLNKYDVTE